MKKIIERMAWCLKQLLPLKYRSKYYTPDGKRHNAEWRMWFGKTYNVIHD